MRRIRLRPAGLARDRTVLEKVMPVITGLSIVTAGNGLLTTITSIALSTSTDVGAVGAIVTGYPVGFLIGCMLARYLIDLAGHGRAFLAMTILTAVVTLAYAGTKDVHAWTLLRVVNGFAMATIFTIGESWINLDSISNNRGKMISIYMIVSTLGLAAGQALINLGDPAGTGLLVASAVICLAGTVPLLLSRASGPERRLYPPLGPGTGGRRGLWVLVTTMPAAFIAAIQTGMTNMSFGTIAPIYAVRIGHDAGTAAMLVILFSVGGLVAQFPVGWLSDRLDRRVLMICLALLSASLCACIAYIGPVSIVVLSVLIFAFGAATLSIYPVTMAYVGARVDISLLVAASGGLLLVHAAGGIVAPAMSNELMIRFGPHAFFLFLGILAVILAISVAVELLLTRGRRVGT